MANGWTQDGAVQDQIDDTVADAVEGARARIANGDGSRFCEDCGEEIVAARRRAQPASRTCIGCQRERDAKTVHSLINRRGSKDSQLR